MRRSLVIGSVLGLAISGASAAPPVRAAVSPAASPPTPSLSCSGGFVADTTANPKKIDILNAVKAFAGSTVWAVGYAAIDASTSVPLAERWNGSSWSSVAVPPFGSVNNQLSGVAGSSSNDVWAVGDEDSGGNPGGLIEHWNGSAWSASTASGAGAGSGFGGVASVSSTNAWAVGSSGVKTFVEHWNGASWAVVPSPSGPGGDGYLAAVSAVTANNIWAVGASGISALIEHWNGTKWSVQASPVIAATSFLSSVREIAANNVWAVGAVESASFVTTTLVEHWNGSSWAIVASPSGSTSFSELTAVAPISTTDVWALGNQSTGALAMRYNGTKWTLVPELAGNLALNGATASTTGHVVWAVGSQENASKPFKTFAEHICPA
jgi:hypothetical protein